MKFEGTFQYMGNHGIVFNVSQVTLTDHRYLHNFAATPRSRQIAQLWRAGLPRAGLRSSPNKPNALYQIHRSGWF